MDKMNEFIKALENGKGYDWMCNHGKDLNKYELIDIIKEYDYAIHSNLLYVESEEIYKSTAESLNEIYSEVE